MRDGAADLSHVPPFFVRCELCVCTPFAVVCAQAMHLENKRLAVSLPLTQDIKAFVAADPYVKAGLVPSWWVSCRCIVLRGPLHTLHSAVVSPDAPSIYSPFVMIHISILHVQAHQALCRCRAVMHLCSDVVFNAMRVFALSPHSARSIIHRGL